MCNVYVHYKCVLALSLCALVFQPNGRITEHTVTDTDAKKSLRATVVLVLEKFHSVKYILFKIRDSTA